MVSRNSHFFLHDGHCSGGVSVSNEYPQLLHFQLGMAITSSVNFFVISGGTLIKQLWSFSKRQDNKFYLHIYCFSLNIFSKNIRNTLAFENISAHMQSVCFIKIERYNYLNANGVEI